MSCRKCVFCFLILLMITIDRINGRVRWRYYYYYHDHSSSTGSDEAPPPEPSLPPATQQDTDDAERIVKDHFAEKTIASIFPYRTLDHRKVINQEIYPLNNMNRLIEKDYLPNHSKNPPFKDLCFALVNDPITVLAMYLGEFLHRRDESFIIIPLTLCQQMRQLHYIYKRRHKKSLTHRRKKQRHPFANLMKVWIQGDREPDNNCNFTPDDVQKVGNALEEEYKNWKDHRDGLEEVVIKKCLKFGAAVIHKFETDLKMTIEDAIRQKIRNHDLVDAYTSLVHYVKDKYGYMARILLDHSNGKDRWAVWIMLIGFIAGDDWAKIDTAFRAISNNVSLKDFILGNAEPDKIFLGMMAAMIDPMYKPNYF